MRCYQVIPANWLRFFRSDDAAPVRSSRTIGFVFCAYIRSVAAAIRSLPCISRELRSTQRGKLASFSPGMGLLLAVSAESAQIGFVFEDS
jgi:hypothetical protein